MSFFHKKSLQRDINSCKDHNSSSHHLIDQVVHRLFDSSLPSHLLPLHSHSFVLSIRSIVLIVIVIVKPSNNQKENNKNKNSKLLHFTLLNLSLFLRSIHFKQEDVKSFKLILLLLLLLLSLLLSCYCHCCHFILLSVCLFVCFSLTHLKTTHSVSATSTTTSSIAFISLISFLLLLLFENQLSN